MAAVEVAVAEAEGEGEGAEAEGEVVVLAEEVEQEVRLVQQGQLERMEERAVLVPRQRRRTQVLHNRLKLRFSCFHSLEDFLDENDDSYV